MSQNRRSRGFCLKYYARVLGTCFADQMPEFHGLIKRNAICVIDHHIGTRRL